ncbi:Fic family protein [Candidatus Micrarchaeota archaeon]|nr:Fic family protein [Candidatus Micrarchaeota archaeon]
MSFVREVHKGVLTYYLVVENSREDGKVRQKVLKYLKDRRAMLDYCMEQSISPPEEKPGLIEPEECERIGKKLAELNSLRPLPPAALESLRRKFEVEMTYNSNAIEGNRLTLRETHLVLERGITIGGKSMKEHLEATNHADALGMIEKLAGRRREGITEKQVLQLHAIILDKIDAQNAGKYRQEQVFITGTEHTPPKWQEVPGLMKDAIRELNSKNGGCGAIESAAKLHHELVWIHPFTDGNGRLARLLSNLRLMRAGFPPIILEKRTRRTYYKTLERADGGDLRPIARLFARDEEKALDLWLSAAK